MLYALALQNGRSNQAGEIPNLQSNHISDMVFLNYFSNPTKYFISMMQLLFDFNTLPSYLLSPSS